MHNTMEKLIRLEKNYNRVEDGKKIVRNGTHMYLLKKMKNDFEKGKISYLEKKDEIEKIKNEYIKISEKIKREKNEMENLQDKIYTQYGSDVRMIERCEKQIDNHKMTIKDMEEKSAGLIEKENVLKIEKESQRQELLTLKNSFEKYKESVSNKVAEANKDIKEGEKEIAILERELSEEILSEFKSIRLVKKSAVVPVKQGICGGCKIKLSSITISKLNKGGEVIYCDNCGRIVYLPEK